jgi:hypothetical protein
MALMLDELKAIVESKQFDRLIGEVELEVLLCPAQAISPKGHPRKSSLII